jgi:hypothetical protein
VIMTLRSEGGEKRNGVGVVATVVRVVLLASRLAFLARCGSSKRIGLVRTD